MQKGALERVERPNKFANQAPSWARRACPAFLRAEAPVPVLLPRPPQPSTALFHAKDACAQFTSTTAPFPRHVGEHRDAEAAAGQAGELLLKSLLLVDQAGRGDAARDAPLHDHELAAQEALLASAEEEPRGAVRHRRVQAVAMKRLGGLKETHVGNVK